MATQHMDSKKLLIADDEPSLRELVAATLRSQDYETLQAGDGVEALALVQRERPTLALLDVNMPGLDGLEVCRRIKGDPELSGTTIIMLTANSRPADQELGLAAGANAYLTKPFSPLQLLRLVGEVMQTDGAAQSPGGGAAALQKAPGKSDVQAFAAFMFIDIRGFTSFTATHGDEIAYRLVQQFLSIVRQQIKPFGGREVNTAGDNILLTFPTAHQAVDAAIAIMTSIKAYNDTGPEHPFEVGIGLDAGEPVGNQANFIGSALNRAARVTNVANKSQILATTTIRQLIADDPTVTLYPQAPRVLRGFDRPQALYEIAWQGTAGRDPQPEGGSLSGILPRVGPVATRLALGGCIITAVVMLLTLSPVRERLGLFILAPGVEVAPVSSRGAGTKSITEIVAESRPFTVLIASRGNQGAGLGTGVIYDRRGLVLTSAHVIEGIKDIEIRFADSTTIPATVLAQSRQPDLAVLRIGGGPYLVAPFGDSTQVRDGEEVIVLGYPGAFSSSAPATATRGIVSQSVSGPGGRYLQINAALNPGVSGGPLINSSGKVIGINAGRIESAGGRSVEGIGFAISINDVREALAKFELGFPIP